MTQDGILVLNFLFSTIWRLFTSFEIPGTHTTPAEWALFSLLAVLVFRLIVMLLGLPSGEASSSGSKETGGSKSSGPSSSNTPHAGM